MRQWIFLVASCLLVSMLSGQSADVETWRAVGYNARINGDYNTAMEYYQKILDEDPGDYDARLALARLLAVTEDYRGALSIFEVIYAEDPTDVEAMNGLGECYGRMGEDSISVVWYEKALEYNSFEVNQYLLLANAYGNAGRMVDAIAVYEQVMEIDATYSEAWAGIGKMYFWLGKPATARKFYQRALELDPANAEILEGEGNVRQELKWGLTLKTSPVQEKEENYTINAIVTRLRLEKRLTDHLRLEANFLLDHSTRDFTGEEGDTSRWFNTSWLQADYLLRHHTISGYFGYSNTDNKVSTYGLSWKMKYTPGEFTLKNTLQAGYDYYYYWNRVGAVSVSDEASVAFRFAELAGRYSMGLVDPVYTIDYSISDSLEVRENPYQSYGISLGFKILKRPDIRLGISHSYLDYTFKSPLYYSPSGRSLTGATASAYYNIKDFYIYGSFSYNLGHEYNYEEKDGNGYQRVKLNVDNWSSVLEIGYEYGPFSFSLGGSNFYNPYYENLTGFVAVKVLF